MGNRQQGSRRHDRGVRLAEPRDAGSNRRIERLLERCPLSNAIFHDVRPDRRRLGLGAGLPVPAETDFAWWLATRRQMLEVNGLDLDPELPGFDSREQVIRRYEQMIGRPRRPVLVRGVRHGLDGLLHPSHPGTPSEHRPGRPLPHPCADSARMDGFGRPVLQAAVRRKNPFGFQFDRAGGGTPGGMQESRGRQGRLQRCARCCSTARTDGVRAHPDRPLRGDAVPVGGLPARRDRSGASQTADLARRADLGSGAVGAVGDVRSAGADRGRRSPSPRARSSCWRPSRGRRQAKRARESGP